MQIEQFTRIRDISIVLTITTVLVIMLCHGMDTNTNDVNALHDYIHYSRQCVDTEYEVDDNTESCSVLLRNDSIYKSDPDHIPAMSMKTVEEQEAFVNGWTYADTHKINPYINAYIKQSLWEYADWCVDEESADYWHMKYIASQKTGGYSYARQIKYKWYKLAYENSPFIVMISAFLFVFVNILCILYGLSGTSKRSRVNKYNSADIPDSVRDYLSRAKKDNVEKEQDSEEN